MLPLCELLYLSIRTLRCGRVHEYPTVFERSVDVSYHGSDVSGIVSFAGGRIFL